MAINASMRNNIYLIDIISKGPFIKYTKFSHFDLPPRVTFLNVTGRHTWPDPLKCERILKFIKKLQRNKNISLQNYFEGIDI